jgi:hypothetical protein
LLLLLLLLLGESPGEIGLAAAEAIRPSGMRMFGIPLVGVLVTPIPIPIPIPELVGMLLVDTRPSIGILSEDPPLLEILPSDLSLPLSLSLSRLLSLSFLLSLNLKKSSSPFFSDRDWGSPPFRAEVLDLVRVASGFERLRPKVAIEEGIVAVFDDGSSDVLCLGPVDYQAIKWRFRVEGISKVSAFLLF